MADFIAKEVAAHKVVLFMKGVPGQPECGFSMMACRILDHYGAPFVGHNVLADPELREGIKKYTDWPTIPQVFVDGEFVGGSDILMSLHQSGELAGMLGVEPVPGGGGGSSEQ